MLNLLSNIINDPNSNYAIFFVVILSTVVTLATVKRLLIRYITNFRDEKNIRFADFILQFLELLSLPLYLIIGIKAAISIISIQDTSVIESVSFLVFFISTIYAALVMRKVVSLAIQSIIKNRTFQSQDPDFDSSGLRFLEFSFNIIIWAAAVLFILQNRNININALVGGLGVAGIAFAFALQNLVSDLFSSISIYTDKPFIIGDYIQIGDDVGEVVKIGLKTTRLKNIKGGEIVISNKELSTSKIKNLSKVGKRKVFMEIKIHKDDNSSIILAEEVPNILKKMINEIPKVKFFAAYLKEVTEHYYIYFLEFETNKMPFKDFIELKNRVNVKMLEVFEDNKIEFSVLN
jgi:small-conductance mechanosensitive channel